MIIADLIAFKFHCRSSKNSPPVSVETEFFVWVKSKFCRQRLPRLPQIIEARQTISSYMDNLSPTPPDSEQITETTVAASSAKVVVPAVKVHSNSVIVPSAINLKTSNSSSCQSTSSSSSATTSLTPEDVLLQLHHGRLTSTPYSQLPEAKDISKFWYSQMKSSLTWKQNTRGSIRILLHHVRERG